MIITVPHRILYAFRSVLGDPREDIADLRVMPVQLNIVRLIATDGKVFVTTLADIEGKLPDGGLAVPAAILPRKPDTGLPYINASIEHKAREDKPDVVSVTARDVTRAVHMPDIPLPKIDHIIKSLDSPPCDFRASRFSAGRLGLLCKIIERVSTECNEPTDISFQESDPTIGNGHQVFFNVETKPYGVHGVLVGLRMYPWIS